MSLRAKVGGDIAVTTALKLSLKIRGIVLIPLLSVGIGVSAYGAFVQAQAIATLIGNVARAGTNDGFVRFVHETDHPDRLFTALFVFAAATSTLAAVGVALGADLLAVYTLSDSGYTSLFAVAAAWIPATVCLELGRSYYRAHRRIKRFGVYEAADVYLMVGGLAVAILGFGAGVVEALAVAVLARCAVTVALLGAVALDGGFGRPSLTAFRACLAFSVGTMGNLISQSLLDKTDRVLIGFFLGAGAVGVYSAAYSLSYVLRLFSRPLSISFFPEFSDLWERDDRGTIRRYTRQGIRYMVGLGLPAVAGYWLVAEGVLRLLSTADVAQAGALVLPVLAAAMLCKGVAEVYTQLFFAAGDSRLPAIIQGGAAVGNAALNLALIPTFGILGAAGASVLSFAAAMAVSALIVQRYLTVATPWGHLGRIAVATGVMAAIFATLSLPWAATVVLAPPVYAVTLVGIGGVGRSELRRAAQIVR